MVAENYQGVFWNIGNSGGSLGIDQTEIAVGGGEGGTVFQEFPVSLEGLEQGFVAVLAPLLPGNESGNVLTEAGEAVRVEAGLGLRHGEKHRFAGIFSPALGQGVEKAHRVQIIAKKFHTKRVVVGWGEDVQNAAAQGVLAGTLHQGTAGITGPFQTGGQFRQGEGIAGAKGCGGGAEEVGGHGAQAQRLQGSDQEGRFPAGEGGELAKTLLLPAAGDGGDVVKGQLPGGEDGRGLAEEGCQLRLEAAGGGIVLADDDGGTAGLLGEGGDEVAPRNLARA